MTLQEAKDETAKKHGYKDWKDLLIYQAGAMRIIEEAAELYARSRWDEACEAQRKLLPFDVLRKVSKPTFTP